MTTEKIRELNDAFRTTMDKAHKGQIVMTAAIVAHCEDNVAFMPKMMLAVAGDVKFTEGNDPHGEHDFGEVLVEGKRVWFKIDYYDATMEYGSEDPADPTKTTRVMTIMFPEDY